MLLVTGVCDRIQEREAGRAPDTWIEKTIVVRDWGQTLYCTVARDFGELPESGESVALDVSVKSYVSKKDPTTAGHQYTAFRRNPEAESALFTGAAAPLRAAQ
jgi:hypothetical protein